MTSPLIRVKAALLDKQKVKVGAEGELVAMTIGNSTRYMSYEAALMLSQFLRIKAKEAKRNAGDNGRHWSAVGELWDATRDTRW